MTALTPNSDAQDETSQQTNRRNNRALNRVSSQQLLESRNIEYWTNNGGVHLIVIGNHGYIDFWPGKGKWKARDGSRDGFGVFNLLEMIETGQL